MASITIKTVAGKSAGDLELDAAMFGIQPNVPVLHQVVTAQLAARRAGTQSTKTRAEVSGGGKKPFKQKGTGNARQGSTRSPHFSGGGVALGPKPRKYDQRTPKKMIKLALRSALSDRAAEGKIVVVDQWGFDAPKTKSAKAALASLGIDGKALVVVDRSDENTIKSFLNLREVQLIERAELNAYDVLCNEYIIFSKQTLPSSDAAAPAVTDAPTPAKKAAADKPAAVKKAAVKKAAVKPAAVKKAAAEPAAVEPAAVAELPAGAVVGNDDGSAPEGHEIKGNSDSGLYHVPGSRFYKQTVAEFWFATADDAEAAGFQLPPSQRDSADEDPS
jgi:large subunit ribosomal protein L4